MSIEMELKHNVQVMLDRYNPMFHKIEEQSKAFPSIEAVTLLEQMNQAITRMEFIVKGLEVMQTQGQKVTRQQRREVEEMLLHFDEAMTELEQADFDSMMVTSDTVMH